MLTLTKPQALRIENRDGRLCVSRDSKMEQIDSTRMFCAAAGLGGLSGLAYLLRSGKEITWLAIFTAMLNSGLTSLSIALLWYNTSQDNPYFLIGVCVLAGLGGASLTDLMIAVLKKKISITGDENDKKAG